MNDTNSNYTYKYNPNGPVGYFLTFRSYGTWLHGDARGSMDRKGHHIPGTPKISSDPARIQFEYNQLKQPPVRFTSSQRKSINSTINNVCNFQNWKNHALNVRTEHIHVVVSSSRSAEFVMNTFKTWCTRKMREEGLWISEHSPWSRHGSTRYLWDEKALHRASVYVMDGQG